MPTELELGAEPNGEETDGDTESNIWIRYKQEGEWVMKRAQWSANRRNLVPGMAKGARIAAEEYLYYLRYQRDGKRIMEPVGRTASPLWHLRRLGRSSFSRRSAGSKCRALRSWRRTRETSSPTPHRRTSGDRGGNEALDVQCLQAGVGKLPRGLPALRLPRPSEPSIPSGRSSLGCASVSTRPRCTTDSASYSRSLRKTALRSRWRKATDRSAVS